MKIPDYSKKRIKKLKEIYNDYVREEDKELIRLTKEVDRLNNIINKAIEHIEKVKDMYTVNEVVNQVGIPILDISIEIWKKELLGILEGSDKE